MPSRPRFSEMLLDRRRQLGLTVGQASQVLKLKEQVLIAFEEGDFDNIPQSGYAQGMLSSYARYLGLNPREIVDLFQEELYEHVHGTSSHELRRRTRDTQSGRGVQGYDVVNEAESRPKAYVQYRGLLPTSGGPAGDMGAFATTSGPRPRIPSSVPLAGSSYPTSSRSQSPAYSHAEYVYGRPYNATSERDEDRERERDRYATRQRGRYAQQRRRVDDPANRLLREGQNGVEERRETARAYRRDSSRAQRLYERDNVSTRSVRAGEYTDDLRYDDGARPYDRASTISGRRSSRNIASVDRPNVRRRSEGQRGRIPGSSRGHSGQDRRTTLLVICALALALTLILVFSIRSCVSSRSTTSQESKTTVPVSTTSTDSSSSDTGSTDSSSTQTTTTTTDTTTSTDGSSTTDASSSDSSASTETVVTVSVASGETSWLEITNDDTSEEASTVTGPWEQSYTVTDSITIRAGNPGVVTVTENGTQKSFDSRVSGIGSLTIQGTPATTDGSSTDTTTGTTTGTSSTSTTGSSSTSGSQTSTGSTTMSSTLSGTTGTTKSN